MENKKTKLTISGNAKKSLSNIELAKTKSKNSVLIEKKNKFHFKSTSNKPFAPRNNTLSKNFNNLKQTNISNPSIKVPTDYEKRKLAEQRATRRLKGESPAKDIKNKLGSKKRELKLTISRALNEEEGDRIRSLASLKRARKKENREINKEDLK